jgi:phage terminase large subunit-like protein
MGSRGKKNSEAPDLHDELRNIEQKAARARKSLKAKVDTPGRPPLPPRPNVEYQPDIPIDFDTLIEANYEKTVEQCVAEIPRDLSEKYAKTWVWNASDELAIRNGCRFDLKRAMHYAYTLRNNLTLWEGRWAGEPFILRTWQPECLLRIYGWVRPHKELDWNRRFSKASCWTCKKHGKSPTGASTGIYQWKWDGTWSYDPKSPYFNTPKVGGGQHVACMAKNGKQAGIVWGHANNMVKTSPHTKAQYDAGLIKSVESWHRLKDVQTLSEFYTITGDSKVALESTEGLNLAGLMVDEAHVVSDQQVEVVTDAGASQDGFLWFQFSTYGDADGYGKKDLEYGREVIAGRVEDDAMFFKTYEAPQTLTDEECGEEKYWRMANPNLGFTVSELQFRQSYERAKNDPAKFAGWKRRRLNIWQRASNPMLNYAFWTRAAKVYV